MLLKIFRLPYDYTPAYCLMSGRCLPRRTKLNTPVPGASFFLQAHSQKLIAISELHTLLLFNTLHEIHIENVVTLGAFLS